MSQHSRNSCCIYLSVCLINILSRSELVRISSVSALSFSVSALRWGGSGIIESSNPGSGRYEEKKIPPSYAFPEEESLLWASEQAQDKHARSQQFTSAWLVNLRTPRVYEWETSQTAKTWKFSHGLSTHLDQNLLVCFNYFKRDSLLLAKNRRAAREKSGWVACCDYIQRGIFSTELACFWVLLYKPKELPHEVHFNTTKRSQ